MKSSQSIINSIEERDNSEIEWEDKMKRGEEMVNQVAYDQMFNNSLFFNYDYSTIREKKMKSLVNKKGNSHGKAAQMIQEHWLKKEETTTILPEFPKTNANEFHSNGYISECKGKEDQSEEITHEEIILNEPEPNYESLDENNNSLTDLMNNMKNDIFELKKLLQRKRENIVDHTVLASNSNEKNELVFDDFDLFLFNFYYESRISQPNDAYECIRDDMKSLNFKQNTLNNKSYLYLYKKIKDSVLEGNKIQLKSNKKLIGLTPQDIFKEKKYQVDLKNLPKFSRFFEKLTNDMEYVGTKTRIYMPNGMDSGYENKHKKKQQTLSFIERQNTEALRAIEEKRQKFKNLPKSNKEKMDNNNLHKHWNWIVKKEIPKMYKIYQKYKSDIDYNCKKLSNFAQKEVKKKVSKVQRLQKESNLRAKRLQKEMLIFWRKRDKEIIEIKKRKDKYEVEKKKREDEIQEMIIQKRRLEYLMKQSDIYSFFMIRNMGMIDKQEDEENVQVTNKEETVSYNTTKVQINGNEIMLNPKNNKVIFQSIKVDIDENAAKEGVKQIIKQQREKMLKFDQQTNKIREAVGADKVKLKNFEDVKELDEERLDKPVINASSQLIEAPRCFIGELKEYQLKGLRWLDNLYDQGINGILADEMGLGKTIQAIAFLSHLAEEKGNWGPFLIVAPNATLYNWQQELNKFCPALKVLPYWGGIKERKTLRKFFNSQNLYSKSAAFHACISSYQLVVSDEKVFHRVNWQYMVLDEAQAIKNINSQRWNTLLSFNCRNRLLLSGTPIQNSMSELWALLHFIMPNLFDSHEQFQEWFSRDIEAHSQEKGELNQEQLNRLHKILKPFMLRRVKKDVENEIGPKIEYEILCEMTERQKLLYNSIKEKLSNISDLFTSVDSKVKVENLMNLVMQFRKVCNHPEIFERNLGKVPFVFRDINLNRSSTFSVIPNSISEMRINNSNSIQYFIPKMIFDLCSKNVLDHSKKYSILTYNNILGDGNVIKPNTYKNFFNFVTLFNFSINEFLAISKMDMLLSHISLIHYLNELSSKNNYYKIQKVFKFNIFINRMLYTNNEELSSFYHHRSDIGVHQPLIVNSIIELKNTIYRHFNKHRFYIPKVISSPVELVCSSSRITSETYYYTNNILLNRILYGTSFRQLNNKEQKCLQQYFTFGPNMSYITESLEKGLLSELFVRNEGYSLIELPSFDRLIADCAKLKKLDEILERLSKENHRVLIFCQMTRMIDILEEYMAKRRYTYFRMDGSTNIADRRDMVNEFQVNPKIFAFLLSTRAGGLGVNLTGADTVIFYDNDWNPTMDAQATDRAHRIGQTKIVSVYRLITKGTIEERILKRAKQKQNVQTTVYAGGAFKADIFKQSEIVELLYSEEEVKRMEIERKKLLDYNAPFSNNQHGDKDENNNQTVSDELHVTKNKKSKINKKDNVVKTEKSKKEKIKNVIKEETKNGENQKSSVQISRSIFAVSNGNHKISTLKVDSSDDENNIIIQDGDGPINMDDDMF